MVLNNVTWNAAQLAELYDRVYGRRMECPVCAERLELAASREPGVEGTAACRTCGVEHVVRRETDPRRGAFRDYTGAEQKQIRAADGRRKSPVCPVDGTIMDVHAQRSLGRTSNVIIRCRRCAGCVEYVRTSG